MLTRWGFRLSRKQTAKVLAWLDANPGALAEWMRNGWLPDNGVSNKKVSTTQGAYIGALDPRK